MPCISRSIRNSLHGYLHVLYKQFRGESHFLSDILIHIWSFSRNILRLAPTWIMWCFQMRKRGEKSKWATWFLSFIGMACIKNITCLQNACSRDTRSVICAVLSVSGVAENVFLVSKIEFYVMTCYQIICFQLLFGFYQATEAFNSKMHLFIFWAPQNSSLKANVIKKNISMCI